MSSTYITIILMSAIIVAAFWWFEIRSARTTKQKTSVVVKQPGEYIVCSDGVSRKVIKHWHHDKYHDEGKIDECVPVRCDEHLNIIVSALYYEVDTTTRYYVETIINDKISTSLRLFLQLWCKYRSTFTVQQCDHLGNVTLIHKCGTGFRREQKEYNESFSGATKYCHNALDLDNKNTRDILNSICVYYEERQRKATWIRRQRKATRDARKAEQKLNEYMKQITDELQIK